MSAVGIGNWHAALANNLPDAMAELRAEVEELDKKKADKLALLADYEELLVIAHRRAPAPITQPHSPAEALFVSAAA